MDSNRVNELFDSRVPELHSQVMSSRMRGANCVPELSTILASLIVVSFFMTFYKLKRRWLVNAKWVFYNSIAKVWKGELSWWFKRFKRIPSDLLEESRIIEKKSKKDINLRLEPLSPEKKLTQKTKQTKELEKTLRGIHYEDAAQDRHCFRINLLCGRPLGPRRRTSFADLRSRKYEDTIPEIFIFDENNQSKDVHLKQIAVLQDEITLMTERMNNLKELNQVIFKLYAKVKQENEQLHNEKMVALTQLQRELNFKKRMQEQIVRMLSSLCKNCKMVLSMKIYNLMIPAVQQ